MAPFFALLRPKHYIKNLLIFFPAFFAQRILEGPLLFKLFAAFTAFSLLASAVYIFNDYHDREADRQHPEKRKRPLAAGLVPINLAISTGIILVLAGLGGLLFLSWQAFAIGLTYIFLNIAYTSWLKKIAIVDVVVIAIGFELRLGIGAAIGDIPLSMWIILMTFLGAMFLGFAKRKDDVILAASGKEVRKSIEGYNLEFIKQAMLTMAPVIIVSYISYTISNEVQSRFESQHLYLSVIWVLLGILRYFQLIWVAEKRGGPTQIFLQDRFLQICVLAWIGTLAILIYY